MKLNSTRLIKCHLINSDCSWSLCSIERPSISSTIIQFAITILKDSWSVILKYKYSICLLFFYFCICTSDWYDCIKWITTSKFFLKDVKCEQWFIIYHLWGYFIKVKILPQRGSKLNINPPNSRTWVDPDRKIRHQWNPWSNDICSSISRGNMTRLRPDLRGSCHLPSQLITSRFPRMQIWLQTCLAIRYFLKQMYYTDKLSYEKENLISNKD